jgi:hypothetical protein
MTILEKAVSTMQQLPIEKQQEALNFIEFLAFKMGDRQVKDDYSLIPARRSISQSILGKLLPISWLCCMNKKEDKRWRILG